MVDREVQPHILQAGVLGKSKSSSWSSQGFRIGMEEKDPILEYNCENLLLIGQNIYSLYGDWCLINVQLIIALLDH